MNKRTSLKRVSRALAGALLLSAGYASAATHRVTFDDMGLGGSDSYANGSDLSGGFLSPDGYALFENNYNQSYGSWDGFALSRVCDTNTPGWANQFAAWTPGTGRGGDGVYAVAYPKADPYTWLPEDAVIYFSGEVAPRQIWLNNTTYAALSMLNGDGYAKKFGGASGTDPDWLTVTLTGKDANGTETGSVVFYLADFRSDDPAEDYIVSDWTQVDLSPLGDNVAMISFTFDSSDQAYGYINTPIYVAIDDLDYIPAGETLDATFDTLPVPAGGVYLGERLGDGFFDLDVHFGNTDSYGYCFGFSASSVCDTNTAGGLNQNAVWTPGHDISTNGNYAVFCDGGEWGGVNEITFPRQAYVKGFYIDNTTYTALSILNGDDYAKQWNATDPDWLKVTISARDADGASLGSMDVYLADYRADDPADDYILSDWTWVDLTGFGPAVKALSFSISGSDTAYGYLNTPAYFAMDGLEYAYTFSGPSGAYNGNDTDAPIPGFCGEGEDGDAEDADNVINPAFAGWATSVAAYAPATADVTVTNPNTFVVSENPAVTAQWQDSSRALGPATGNHMDIVALGELDSDQIANGDAPGSITLVFATPITDKAGPDFAVFENGMIVNGTDQRIFAELGYVEVSSDGTNFVRFPASCLVVDLDDSNGIGYEAVDSRYLYNLCGKHVNNRGDSWGTPFDLSELSSNPSVADGTLDLSNVTHVRIVDIPGDGSFNDAFGRPIRDAWVTYGSGGVDLEAVGVLNSSAASRIDLRVTGPGSVSPIGKPSPYVSVLHGDDCTFTFTPSNGCEIVSVTLDGVEQALVKNTLTLENLQADHVIAVAFAEDGGTTAEGVPYSWLLSNDLLDAESIAAAGSIEAAAAIAAASDDDNDGQSAAVEYFAGTDPLDDGDSFRIIGIETDAQGCTITWLGGATGSTLPFEMVVRTNLSASVPPERTVLLESPRQTSGTNTWTDVNNGAAPRFYQIRIGGGND